MSTSIILDKLTALADINGGYLVETDVVIACWDLTDEMIGPNGAVHLMELAFNFRKAGKPIDQQVLSDIRSLTTNGNTLQEACVIAEVLSLCDTI